ncbi:MAG: ATP-binding protein [Clostridia bacterium]|nr:ATP-binding protein [Clostridia bacterium]
MTIQREWYLEKLKARMHNGMIKVITGMRRSGKSFLLFNLFYDYLLESGVRSENVIALNLEDEEYAEYRDPHKLSEYLRSKIGSGGQYYVLLDEVQYAISPSDIGSDAPLPLYGVLNGLLRKTNVDVYVTGSNSRFLSSDIRTEFRGRGDEVRVQPLSFSEFMSGYEGDKYDGLRDYMTYGGLPQITFFKTHEQKAAYLTNLFEETYIKDILARYNVRRNANEFGELVDVLASGVGSLTNPMKLSNTFKSTKNKALSPLMISKYIGYMEDSFLIDDAKQYDVKGKRYINSPRKYYFTDMGLRNARLNFRQLEETHAMENLIYNELKLRGFSVDVGVIEKREKSEDGRSIRKRYEIDFVANQGFKRYYIQSALAMPTLEKEQQEQRSLVNVNDSFKKIIIVGGPTAMHYNENGVLIMGIHDFLLKKDSLNL